MSLDQELARSHPVPFIGERVDLLRQKLVILKYAVMGIVRLEDHSELADEPVRAALSLGLDTAFDDLAPILTEIDACLEHMRAVRNEGGAR